MRKSCTLIWEWPRTSVHIKQMRLLSSLHSPDFCRERTIVLHMAGWGWLPQFWVRRERALTKRPFFPQSTKGEVLLKQDTLRSDPASPFPGLVCSCIPGSCVIDYSNSCGSCSSSELDAPLRHRPICSFTDISQHKGCFFMRRQRISTKAFLERLREWKDTQGSKRNIQREGIPCHKLRQQESWWWWRWWWWYCFFSV